MRLLLGHVFLMLASQALVGLTLLTADPLQHRGGIVLHLPMHSDLGEAAHLEDERVRV